MKAWRCEDFITAEVNQYLTKNFFEFIIYVYGTKFIRCKKEYTVRKKKSHFSLAPATQPHSCVAFIYVCVCYTHYSAP